MTNEDYGTDYEWDREYQRAEYDLETRQTSTKIPNNTPNVPNPTSGIGYMMVRTMGHYE